MLTAALAAAACGLQAWVIGMWVMWVHMGWCYAIVVVIAAVSTPMTPRTGQAGVSGTGSTWGMLCSVGWDAVKAKFGTRVNMTLPGCGCCNQLFGG